MKKVFILLVGLLATMAASISATAQEITITLYPGVNWISYPNAEAMDIASAFGNFTPAQGDIIKSQYTSSVYSDGCWMGGVTHLVPGSGYKYYSNRTEVVDFSFAQPASNAVATATPTGITATSAVVGGMVILPEGTHVFLRGVCWGTESNPDIDGGHTSDGTGIGSFSSTLEGLNPATTYYVRAYVLSDHGLAYGSEQSFTTEAGGSAPIGAINGKFSINNSGDQVYFSQGNLQYQASTNTWRFAENQWDYVGTQTPDNYGLVGGTVTGSDNRNISQTYSGWIDLFGWGTSGCNHGANCYQPWSTSTSYSDYYAYGSLSSNLYNQTGMADWGVYNPLSNGGNQANQWRTLTQPEWNYVFYNRSTTSGIRFAKAKVNDVNGVILLPDDWSSDTYNLSNANTNGVSYSSNVITASQWNTLEQAGAVFLPSAGYRYGTSVCLVGDYGYYWLSSYFSTDCARGISFDDANLGTDESRRGNGQSVRLVAPAEN
jgi:hypothetical protein